jgi:hypothetical protein
LLSDYGLDANARKLFEQYFVKVLPDTYIVRVVRAFRGKFLGFAEQMRKMLLT